ncbi:sigma-70 family RNA polymerase sigma factor [Devosia aurantiaca]|uniref:Uncharacterized protein n=1 Tax=Devosia aurantiaca TaxID=2714858 RepID=A0A6M1SIM4_9HYPH|nr:hypothetical protein [Devosia aurantiaca]NGP19317.1 hypothetical protein [Devosia aurantiaca]
MTPDGREIIRAGYAAGRPVADIARDCQSTPGSVKVIAHHMGIRHPNYGKRPKPHRPGRLSFAGKDKNELRWGGKTMTGALRS